MPYPKLHLTEKYGKRSSGKKYFKGYYLEAYDPHRSPKQKRRSLGTKDKSAARQKFTKLEKLAAMDEYDPWTDSPDQDRLLFAEAARLFLKSCKRDELAQTTLNNYESALRIFRKSLPPGLMLHAIKTEHIRDFLDERDIAAETRRTYLTNLTRMFNWCVEQGYLKENPAPDPPRGSNAQKKKAYPFLTERQFKKVIRTAQQHAASKKSMGDNQWLIDALRFAVGTGLRRKAVCFLEWGNVDVGHRPSVSVAHTDRFTPKHGIERTIPLTGRAFEVICRLHAERETKDPRAFVLRGASGGQLSGEYTSERFRKYRRIADLPEELHFHSLRHTFASWCVQRGADLYRVNELMGHKTLKQTMRYSHLRQDSLRETMEKVFGGGWSKQDRFDQLHAQLESLQAENEQLREKLKE